MKRFCVFALAMLMLTVCCVPVLSSADNAEETDRIYDEYKPVYYDAWYADHDGYTIADGMRSLGVSMMDFDAFTRSELGDYAFGLLVPFFTYGDDVKNEENIAYWKRVGMDYHYHDADDADRKWIALTPDSMEEGKKYPVLFVWHGNDNVIMVSEHFGFGEIAAEKKWIVVCPWAKNNDIYLEEFDRIMGILKQEYPIDETRIYTTGFSKGGRVSQRLSFERPEVIAAAATNGAKAKKVFDEFVEGIPGHVMEDYTLDYAVPISFFAGEFDHGWAMTHETEEDIAAVNNWLTLHGLAAEQSLDLSHNLRRFSKDPVENHMGLKFDETRTLHEDGVDVWVGDFKDSNGVTVMRFTEQAGAIHSPTHYMCVQAVEFLENFAKDPETGRTVYLGK